jgi:DNA-binding transcriptional LysR family regulator
MVLDAIASRGSFAAAAEQMNKVPSALSYIVQKLEEQLDVTLFQRQGRRSVLTPAGKHLLAEGRHILDAVSSLTERTRSIATGWEPKIRIAIDSMFNNDLTFKVFAQFLEVHPRIEIDISEEVMRGSWEALINDEVDLLLGASGPVPQHQGIYAVAIAELDMVFAVSPNHPLAKEKKVVSRDSIAQQRTVVVHDSAKTSIPWTRGLITENHYFYVPTVDCKIRAQLNGVGCGYLPRNRVKTYLDRGELVEVDISAVLGDERDHQAAMYLARKLANKGKGVAALSKLFMARLGA